MLTPRHPPKNAKNIHIGFPLTKGFFVSRTLGDIEDTICSDFHSNKLLKEDSFTHFDLPNDKSPGCLRYIGDEILPNYIGIIISNHDIRIPISQPGFNGK